jgi:hypothetical protein
MINIVIRKDSDNKGLIDTIKKCTSDKYNVVINICDYSLQKNINVDELKSFANVSYHELDYEDAGSHESKIIELSSKMSYLAFIDIDLTLELEENFINDLEIETLEDSNIGVVYSDFYSRTSTNRSVYVHQKSFPVVSNTLPIIAFSMQNYVKNQGNENIKGFMLSGLISKHVPKALCSILND